MAWNEPGGSKDNDPWGNRGGKDQGPPDLDEVVRNMQKKLNGIFGGKGKGGGDDGATPIRPGGSSGAGGIVALVLVALVLMAVWDSIHIIQPAERGVVLRFGQYVDTMQPGMNWTFPRPIDTVLRVDVDQIRNVEIGYRSSGGRSSKSATVPTEALMLTRDENIVDVQFAVQYKIKSAKDYLFSVRDPDLTLREATESAVREIVGKSNMDFVLTEGRGDIVNRVQVLIQEIIDRYTTGLIVTSVNMQDAQPPEQVQHAFDDAVKSREDKERLVNEAQAYSNDILPRARGAAARQIEEASGYKEQVVAQAEGEAQRFERILAEYKKAPEVTRERLYLETIEQVFGNSTKVMVDVEGGNNLLYLPLDRMMSGANAAPQSGNVMMPTQSQLDEAARSAVRSAENLIQRDRDSSRSRERR